MRYKIDNLISQHRDDLLKEILDYFGRLATVVAVMIGAGLVMRFSSLISSTLPTLVFIAGSILLIASFILLAWVGVSGWHKVVKIRGLSWASHIFGVFILIFSTLFVVAGVHAAFNT